MSLDCKVKIKIDGAIKLCKYSIRHADITEYQIRHLFSICDLEKMKTMVRKSQVADPDWFKETADKMGLFYNIDAEEFDLDSENDAFFTTYPELTFGYPAYKFLCDLYNGKVVRTPMDGDMPEKRITYVITVDLDNNTITVHHNGEEPYTLPLTMLYTDRYTTVMTKSGLNGSVLYKCAACKSVKLMRSFNYCPMCGRKKLRIVPIPDNWSDDYKEKEYDD